MSKTQYKFYKTTCTAGNIDTTSATKNPFKLDEVENGGIVLAVNDTSDPNFGRMYFKNPFGTAYDTDGKLFEVGTNVSTLNVNGNATVGGGDIVLKDAIIRSTTESGAVRRILIGTKPSGNGPIEQLSRIEFNSQNVTMSGNVTVSDNLYVGQIAGVDNRSITVGSAVYFNEDVSFDQDVNIGESLVVGVGINTNDLVVGTGDSGILTVNGELYSKINNVNQFYVDSNGTYVKGPLTVDNAIGANGTITSTGGSGFSTNKGYAIWRPNQGGGATRTFSVDVDGNIESNAISTNRITTVPGSSVVRVEMPDTVFGSYAGGNTQINNGVINTNRTIYCPGIVPLSTASYSIGSPTMSWYQIFLDRRKIITINSSSASISWTAGLGLYDAKVNCHAGSNVTCYLCRMNIPYVNEEYETPIGPSGFLKYKLSNNSLFVSATHSSASVDSIEIISYGVKLVN